MAESIVHFILGKLADATVQELLHLCGVEKQVKLVSDELGWVQAFLKDADKKNSSGDERQRHWVKEMREVVYDIEDAIDKACLLGIDMDDIPNKRHRKRDAVKRMFKSPQKLAALPALHELGVEINLILERIKKISERREMYGTNNLGEGSGGHTELSLRPLLVPDFDDPDVVGFKRHRDNIVNKLLDNSIRRRYVVSIVGTGGLGKTTLARKAYNSYNVKREFNLCIWIPISQQFKLADILRKLVEQVRGKPVDLSEREKEEEYFHTELYKSLLEKKYLVVLDDVWTDTLWAQIKEAFPDTNNGSRVLITTRSSDVARKFDSPLEPYELPFLEEGPSLDLFLRKAFPYQDLGKGYPKNLSNLAKELVKMCGGLPLALVVLGGLLSRQPPNEHSWRMVMQKMNWRADVTNVLATSYDDLPFAVKSCFMYFAMFPEDYQIDARALIRMWVAEGFITHNNNKGTLEDTAENFLEDLVQRSMVQVSKRAPNGSISECYIHDLLHDMAIRKAEEDNFIAVMSSNQDDQKSCNGARRVALHHREVEDLVKDDSPNLRSLLCFKGMTNVSRHRQLKVLLDMGMYFNWDFEQQTNVYHEGLASLRYLQLTLYTHNFEGSKNMRFLQTLDIRRWRYGDDEILDSGYPQNFELPESIWHIKTLRHILLPYSGRTLGPPPLVDMRNLHTLAGVVPRPSWKDQGLPMLPFLRELHMKLEYDNYPWKVIFTFLGTLKHLNSLYIKGYLGPGKDTEIRNTWKHIYLNHASYWSY